MAISGPLVSVVIPSRNRAALLGRAISSVLAQTVSAWELIIVDDASIDDTSDRIEALSRSDTRIRSIRLDSAIGAPGARNVGIAHASSDLIAFLDDDDEWLPRKIEDQITALRADTSAGVSCTHFFEIDESGRVRLFGGAAGGGGDLRRRLYQGNVLSFSTAVVRRSVLLSVGCLDERLPRLQDWDLWLRLSRITRFTIVPRPLARIHRTAGSISLQPRALDVAASLLLEAAMTDPAVGRSERSDLQHALGQLLVANGLVSRGRSLVLKSLRHPWPPRRVLIDLLLLLGQRPYLTALRARDAIAANRAAIHQQREPT